jgi:alkanesulfonate monooxygenase SsuD/methylene tetrahydromethanopterin reductase-like flavin-dependent oxidoreductase (luciferase family)
MHAPPLQVELDDEATVRGFGTAREDDTDVSIGVSLSTSAAAGADPVADACRAEDLGYDFLSVSDHPSGTHPTFETWTLLTWAAAHTRRIGLVPNVLGLPYREPVVVAKMAETLDRLSRGRLILGLGAGGSDEVMRSLGLRVRTPAGKVEAMQEEIEILRGLWTEETVTHRGTEFQLEGAQIEPKAERYIPIWVGAYGRRMVEMSGRLADGWSPSLAYAPLAQAVERRKDLVRAAEEAGRDPERITCNYNIGIRVGGQARDERVVAGTAAEVVDRLMTFVEAGFTSLNLWPLGEDQRQVELLGREVVPEVRRRASSLA